MYIYYLQVDRPMSMKKEGIQTRKRKPKTSYNHGKAHSLGKIMKKKMIIIIKNNG